MEERLSIGQVAARAGMRASAIRYYERIGLLPPPERAGGRREYDGEVLTRLRLITMAKQAGFSLDEVALLLSGIDEGVAPSERWRQLAERKLDELTAVVRRIEGIRRVLRQSLECGCLRLEDCRFVNDRRLAQAEESKGGRELSPARGPAGARA